MQTTIDDIQKVLNPFSVSLEKHPYMEMRAAPIFMQGDYRIYKYTNEHYVHTYKNIVIAERCAPNKELINNLINDTKPEDETRAYFDYTRAKEAILDGIKAAKKLKFTIA